MSIVKLPSIGDFFYEVFSKDLEFMTAIHEGLSLEVSSKVYLSSDGDTPHLPLTLASLVGSPLAEDK